MAACVQWFRLLQAIEVVLNLLWGTGCLHKHFISQIHFRSGFASFLVWLGKTVVFIVFKLYMLAALSFMYTVIYDVCFNVFKSSEEKEKNPTLIYIYIYMNCG